MKVHAGKIPGVRIVEPSVHGDERGFFMESYSRDRYAEAGIPDEFVQDNVSLSAKGILRGLHLQHPNAQGKLCFVLEGEVFDVAVDVRVGSPTFGQWEGVTLSSENKRQLYVPPGFAHGFCVLRLSRQTSSYKVQLSFYSARRDDRTSPMGRPGDRDRMAYSIAAAIGQGSTEPPTAGHPGRHPPTL